MRMMISLACLMLLTVTGGSMAIGQAKSSQAAGRSGDAVPARGLEFARTYCAACHAVDAGISPKPEAPSFEAIANMPGLTAETLKPWLRDSHNYPEIMNFAIAPAQIDDLAHYMLTLKDPAYRRPIQ